MQCRNMSQLKTLSLTDNQVLPDEQFMGMNQLRELCLANNRITTIRADMFSRPSQLYRIELDHNLLTKILDEAFNVLNVSLREIYLHNNRLLRISETVFSELSLTLNGNPFDCDCQLAWIRNRRWNRRDRYIPHCFSPPEVNGTSVLS